MTGAMIFQLIVALGPAALQLIPKLVANWTTEMTVDQVIALISPTQKDYDTYIAEAKARLTPLLAIPPSPVQ